MSRLIASIPISESNGQKKTIVDLVHPEYMAEEPFWRKWRLTYEGGDNFVEEYLEKFSKREHSEDFTRRKKVTPIPTFAKAAVNDIKNAIFQRTVDITRSDGPASYTQACQGKIGGVDLDSGSMNWFMGDQVLPELLTMRKVGVYVDSPPISASTSLQQKGALHPYLYVYRTENIRTWSYKPVNGIRRFVAVLLRDCDYELDNATKLPTGTIKERYRFLFLNNQGTVTVQFYNGEGKKEGDDRILNIRRIPFHTAEISDSLLKDIANYQIALMNLESSDIGFCLLANYPFYIEQYNPALDSSHLRGPTPPPSEQCFEVPATTNGSEIQVGTTQGRRYPIGTERPGFIAPQTEPLEASMKKQGNLKEDIRLLINLALSNIKPKMASAESKAMDQAGLESGLSYIGLELENLERQIGEIWAEYERETAPTIKYPARYSLKTDEEERKEASEILDRQFSVPSKTYSKEINKRAATILIGTKVSAETLTKIHTEIDESNVVTADPTILQTHHEAGFVSTKTASMASGYPEQEHIQARIDHAERLKRIQEAQTPKDLGARGISDKSIDPDASSKEKQNKPTRGEES